MNQKLCQERFNPWASVFTGQRPFNDCFRTAFLAPHSFDTTRRPYLGYVLGVIPLHLTINIPANTRMISGTEPWDEGRGTTSDDSLSLVWN